MRETCGSCGETFHDENMSDCPRCLGGYCYRCYDGHRETCQGNTRPAKRTPSFPPPVSERIGEAREGAAAVYVDRGEDVHGLYMGIRVSGERGTSKVTWVQAKQLASLIEDRDATLAAQLREAADQVHASTKSLPPTRDRALSLAPDVERYDVDLAARLREFARSLGEDVREVSVSSRDTHLAYEILGIPEGPSPSLPWVPPPDYDPLA